VRKDEPLLLSSISEALKSITKEEQNNIFSKWIKIKIKHEDFTYLWWFGIVLFLIFVGAFYKHFSLKKKQKELEDTVKDVGQLLESTIEGMFLFDKGI